jgi:hypothetical protein
MPPQFGLRRVLRVLLACVTAGMVWWGREGGLRAQTGTSVIQGKVISAETRAAIPDAIVTVNSPALQGGEVVITDASGFYRIPNLPPGVYTVHFDKDGHRGFEQADIQLRSNATFRIDGVLVPDTVKGEELYLAAGPPTIDVGSSSVATHISEEMTRRVPIGRPGTKGAGVRSFESIAQAAPEAKGDLYGTSMSGATSPENRYLVDGLAVNNTAYGIGSTPLSAEFIKEVSVVTGGYLPEYGRSTGGVIDVVTKSGSNKFLGSAWSFVTPGALSPARKSLLREGNTIAFSQPEISFISDLGADVGGPIIADKLWFYVGADLARSSFDFTRSLYQTLVDAAGMPLKDGSGNDVRAQIPGTTQPYSATSQAAQVMGKLTYSPTRTQSFNFTTIIAPFSSGGDGDYGIDPQNGRADPPEDVIGSYNATAYMRRNNAYDNLLKWTASAESKRLVVDTILGWHHETFDELPSDGSTPGSGRGLSAISGVRYRRSPALHTITDFEPVPPFACIEPDPTMATVCPVANYSRNSLGIIRQSTLDRYQARSTMTLLVNALGHHVIKAGVDFELTSYDIAKAYSGGNLFRERPDGTAFDDYRQFSFLTGPDQAVLFPVLKTKTKSYTVGGFLQNSWSVMDKATVNVGVRYDAQFMTDTHGKLGLSLPNQWSPRLGFIWDPTQAGRSRVFGSYARYFENVPLDLADRQLSGEPQLAARHNSPPCDPSVPANASGPACNDYNNLRTRGSADDPNQKWSILGSGTTPIDPALKPPSLDELVLGAEYELVIGSRLGLTYTRRRLNDIVEDMSRDEGTTYFLGNPGRGIAQGFPLPQRDYDALTLSLNHAFSRGWLAQASYTLSWLRGNYSGLFRPESEQLDPNITSDFDLQSLLPNRNGPLPGDRRHQIKLFGARDWAVGRRHEVLTGIGFNASSGDPSNYLGSNTAYGPDEVFILKRGSGPRLPWTTTVDLRLGYTFAYSKDYTLSATMDVFNLLNTQTTTRYDQRYTNADVNPVVGGKGVSDLGKLQNADGTPFDPKTKFANFGRPLQSQDPTVFRFGLRASF